MGGAKDSILPKTERVILEVANFEFTAEEASFGKAAVIAKGNEDLLEVVNSVLQKAMDDGTVEPLTDKHLKICAEG